MFKIYSFKFLMGALFGVLLIAVVVLIFLSYKANKTSQENYFRVHNTIKIIDQAEEISSLPKDIQLESNAFYISGDSSLFMPYDKARSVIIQQVKNLRNLTHDEYDQQLRIDSLESVLSDLLVFTDSVFMVNAQKSYSQNALLKRVNANIIYRNKIRHLIEDIKNKEKESLNIREYENQASISLFNNTFYLLLAGMAMVLAITFGFIIYIFNKRIQAEQELKNANELFFKLFHESPIGLIISQTSNGVILNCNKAYSELINYQRDEIIGKSEVMLNILSEAERSQLIKNTLQKGTLKDTEMMIQPKDKDPVWVSVSTQLIKIQNQECLLCAILDMTIHKYAEEEILKSLAAEMKLSQMKSNFVSMASHEFRTPLATILSSLFLLKKYSDKANQDKFLKHVEKIKFSVNNLTAILDDCLSLTKLEEGKVKPKVERLNLKPYLDKVCQNFNKIKKSDQNIFYHHHGKDEIYIDPVILGNILSTLVSNASKYSPPGTDIIISSVSNHAFHLSVKDAGIGILKEDQLHLFERFYRASNAGTVQGTGLGLYIMKHYVDILNGSIEVDSEIGKGTEFKITFGQSFT
jgi:PAS domain S-box-containing protein